MTTALDERRIDVPDVQQMLLELVAPARAQLDQLEAAEAELKRQLDEIRRAKHRLAAVIRVAQPGEQKPRKSTKSKNDSTVGISDERVGAVLNVFERHPHQELCGTDIEREVSFGSGPVYVALRRLEQDELIRFAGTGGQTGKARLYRLMPNEG